MDEFNNFEEMNNDELMSLNGGGFWKKLKNLVSGFIHPSSGDPIPENLPPYILW